MTTHYWQRKQSIDHLFDIVDDVLVDENIDDEIKACLAKYLCVVVSGFLETSIQDIYTDYAQRKSSHPNIINYVSKKLILFQNPKIPKIIALSGGFCQTWQEELEHHVKNEDETKDQINSLVNIRNQIAHGRDVGITYSNIKEYYASSVKLLRFIESQCKK